jgi:hypothetical protein
MQYEGPCFPDGRGTCDASGNGYHLPQIEDLSNGYYVEMCPVGWFLTVICVQCGSTSFARPEGLPLAEQPAFTFEAWFYASYVLFALGESATTLMVLQTWGFGTWPQPVLVFWDSDTFMATGAPLATFAGPEFADGPHHIAVAVDFAGGAVSMYFDGLAVPVSAAGTLPPAATLPAGPFGLAGGELVRMDNLSPEYWGMGGGAMGEVKVWAGVRDEESVCTDAHGVYDPAGPSCTLPAAAPF